MYTSAYSFLPCNRYSDYLSDFRETSALADRLEAAAEEAEALSATVSTRARPEVAAASKEVRAILRQMEELEATVQVAKVIRLADAAMTEANRRLDRGDLLGAARKLG